MEQIAPSGKYGGKSLGSSQYTYFHIHYLSQQAEDTARAAGVHNKDSDEKILLLSEKITALVAEAETAGCSGNVEQAQGLLKLSDQLREEREQLRHSLVPGSTPLPPSHALREEYAAQQKAMEVRFSPYLSWN